MKSHFFYCLGQPNPQRNGAQMFITDFVDKRAIFEQWGQDMARLTKMTQAELRRLRYRESTVKKVIIFTIFLSLKNLSINKYIITLKVLLKKKEDRELYYFIS